MNAEFVLEIVEHEQPRYANLLTGWESIVFQVEDEPESADSRKACQDVRT